MLVPIVISGPMAKICVRMMTNQNFPQKAKHFKKKIRILFALITLWVLTMLILSQTGWLNFKIVCSLLRLHPDGNSVRSTMLVINGTPVGFLSWEALDAIESQDISSSEDVMDILSQGKDWFKAI